MSDAIELENPILNDTIALSTPSERLKLISKARALSAAAARLQRRNSPLSSKRTVQPQSIEEAHAFINYKFGETQSNSRISDVHSSVRLPSREIEAVVVPTSIPLRPLTVRVDKPSSSFESKRSGIDRQRVLDNAKRPNTVAVGSSCPNTHNARVFEPFSESKTALISSLIKPFASITKTVGNISIAEIQVQSSASGDDSTKRSVAISEVSGEKHNKKEKQSKLTNVKESEINIPSASGMAVSVLSLHAPSIPSGRRHYLGDMGDSLICGSQLNVAKKTREILRNDKGARIQPPFKPTSQKKKNNFHYISRIGKQAIGNSEPGYFARRPLQEAYLSAFSLPENVDEEALHEAYLQFAKLHENAERDANSQLTPIIPQTNKSEVASDTQTQDQVEMSILIEPEAVALIRSASVTSEPQQKREPFPYPNELVTYNEPILIPGPQTIEENQKWQAQRQGIKSSVLSALWVPVQNIPPIPNKPIATIRPIDDLEDSDLSEWKSNRSMKDAENPAVIQYGADMETNISARKTVEHARFVELSSALRSSTGIKGSHRSMTQEVTFEEVKQKKLFGIEDKTQLQEIDFRETPLLTSSGQKYLGFGGGDGNSIDDEQTVYSSPTYYNEKPHAAVPHKSIPGSRQATAKSNEGASARSQSPFPYDLFASANIESRPRVIARRPITSDPALVLGKLTELFASQSIKENSNHEHPSSIIKRPLTTSGKVASLVDQELASISATLGHSFQKQLLLGEVNVPNNLLQKGSDGGPRPKSYPVSIPQSLRPSLLPAVGKKNPDAQLGSSDETLHVLDDRAWLIKNAAGLAALSQRKATLQVKSKKSIAIPLKKAAGDEKTPEVDISGVTLKGKDDPFAHIPAFEALKTAVQETNNVRLSTMRGNSSSSQNSSAVGKRYPSESTISMGDLASENMGMIDDSSQSDMHGVNKILKGLDPKVAATLRHGHGGLSNASPRAVNAAVEAVTLQAGRLRLWKEDAASWSQKRSNRNSRCYAAVDLHAMDKANVTSISQHKRGLRHTPKAALLPDVSSSDDKQDNHEWEEGGDGETEELSGAELERQLAILRQKIGIRGLSLST